MTCSSHNGTALYETNVVAGQEESGCVRFINSRMNSSHVENICNAKFNGDFSLASVGATTTTCIGTNQQKDE